MKQYRQHYQKGFTLIELLAVIIVFSLIGSLAGSILVNSLRTSNKTNVVTTVKENGNFAITQMGKILRDATSLQSPYPCVTPVTQTSVTLVASDGNTVVLDCAATDGITGKTTIASNSAPLIDTSVSGVKLLSPGNSAPACSFTCSQSTASDYPVIDVMFGLTQQATSNFSEQNASSSAIIFSTSILLRNLAR